ncbi:MAG: KH domain-containing protein [Candidatus Altiarchaeota archaeon]
MQTVRIPEDRVSVLIGREGQTKRDLESRSKTRITIAETEVTVEGDPVMEWKMKDIVHAIGRGFAPDKARQLLKDDYVFDLIELGEIASSPRNLMRVRGRVIGEKGRTRRFIERNTNTLLSVYGKTIGIIGSFNDVALAREAVSMLVNGAKHSTVYRMLEKRVINKRIEV